MYENIDVKSPNVCIGPQTGTYCSINTTVSPVVMDVKTELGTLIRSYSFSPSTILNSEPYGSTTLTTDGYFKSELVDFKYVGPRDTSSYYNGAVFYTLEKRAKVVRTYYTYNRDPLIYGEVTLNIAATGDMVLNCYRGSKTVVISVIHSIVSNFSVNTKVNLKSSRFKEEHIISSVTIIGTTMTHTDLSIELQYIETYIPPSYDYFIGDKVIIYDDLPTSTKIEYSSNIIRKWVLNSANFRLDLTKTIIKNSDSTDWFDANTFTIENYSVTLQEASPKNSKRIVLSQALNVQKYDILLLGPSTDTDNMGVTEEVEVHEVVGNVITLKTTLLYDPPMYDYVIGDKVTVFKSIYLFSNSMPKINLLDIMDGNTSAMGTLYKLNQHSYGEIIDKKYSGIYSDIRVCDWNNYYNTLSFIKYSNLLHISINDYEVMRSQNVGLIYSENSENIIVYALVLKDTTIYKLQKKIIKRDDINAYVLSSWANYNISKESLIPYTYTVSLRWSNPVITIGSDSVLSVEVRDQFGVGLSDKNVWYSTIAGDIGATLIPSGGYITTDSDGCCVIRYIAGNSYEGNTTIRIKVDGSNTAWGSQYVISNISILQIKTLSSFIAMTFIENVSSTGLVVTYIVNDGIIGLMTKTSLMFPNDLLADERLWRNYVGTTDISGNLLMTVYPLHLHPSTFNGGVITMPDVKFTIVEYNTLLCNNDLSSSIYSVITQVEPANTYSVSNNYISRHVLDGHSALATLNQFTFNTEARPAMWSEKNNVDTDFWIRLRPYASDLNYTTLCVKLKEHSFIGEGDWVEVTKYGQIIAFNAGGGLQGLEFLYRPAKKFHNSAMVEVYVSVFDMSTVPNKIEVEYWFKLIADFKAPYIVNLKPKVGEVDVLLDTTIMFDVIDSGEGVNINTLEVTVNNEIVEFDYIEYEYGNYHVSCKNVPVFNYGQVVNITVDVKDRSENENRFYGGWVFTCVYSGGPWINTEDMNPSVCTEGKSLSQGFNFQSYAVNDTGIDPESIKLTMDGEEKTIILKPIVYRV